MPMSIDVCGLTVRRPDGLGEEFPGATVVVRLGASCAILSRQETIDLIGALAYLCQIELLARRVP